MGKVKKRLAVDSMILIYLLEGNDAWGSTIEKHLDAADEIIFSSFGLGEVLTGFEKAKDVKGKLRFLSFVETYEKLKVIGFGKQEALIFARLRAKYPSIKPPDAVHLATAVSGRADGFLTNDRQLQCVKEVPIVML